MDNRIIYILFFVGGFIACYLLFKPETETVISYKETIKTDTVYTHSVDTVYLTKKEIKQTVIRDTVLIKPIEPKIKAFTAVYPLQYGNATVNGEVLGEVLKMGLTTDFNIPIVTNEIIKEKTSTIIKHPKGIYGIVGSNTDLNISIGATYLNNKSLIGYEYQPQIKLHSVRVGWKIF